MGATEHAGPPLAMIRLQIHPSIGPGPPSVSVALIRSHRRTADLLMLEHCRLKPELQRATPMDIYEAVMEALCGSSLAGGPGAP